MLQILPAYPLEQTNSLVIFFIPYSIAHPSSSLHSLLPPPRDPDLPARLQAPNESPAYPHEPKKVQSFVSPTLNQIIGGSVSPVVSVSAPMQLDQTDPHVSMIPTIRTATRTSSGKCDEQLL